MMPLFKLEKLPRSLRLRKIAKAAAAAEHALVTGGSVRAEAAFLAGAVEMLRHDEAFPAAVRAALEAAGAAVKEAAKGGPDAGPPLEKLRRAFNTLRHILMAETGRYPADWDFDAVSPPGGLDSARRRIFPGMEVYLEDIRSPFNVGAMFRTAESFGAEKIRLSPLCADPNHPRAARTAMGCVSVLPWERRELAEITEIEGPFFALETGGVPLGEFSFPRRAVLIVGSEELGVSPEGLAAADASLGRVSIVTFGAKGSLNVSAAFGIVMQAWAQAELTLSG
ncbi:MAG: TrmH family RNA methyltransferase [Spirochaetaceae bacterium]|jgi:TrmH family RNA methyltransferase|nr:TrmH family RNA methyltransferase [Spirochaetaceae bacterium]